MVDVDWTTPHSVLRMHVPTTWIDVAWAECEIVALSPSVARLTQVLSLGLHRNLLTAVPPGVLQMTQLTRLTMTACRLAELAPAIGGLNKLVQLQLGTNCLETLPPEIALLTQLQHLFLDNNRLTSLPALGTLRLQWLQLSSNRLRWLPADFELLPVHCWLNVADNPLGLAADVRPTLLKARRHLPRLAALSPHIAPMRDRATVVAIALQDLELPALVTLEIVDAVFVNSVPMHLKWDLITAVKHFRQRRHR